MEARAPVLAEWLDFVNGTWWQGHDRDDDPGLVRFTTSVAEAADEITRFYANYTRSATWTGAWCCACCTPLLSSSWRR